jgi:predicted transcriptional regulator
MTRNEMNPSETLMQYLIANWINYPLYVVCKLGIPDLLGEGTQQIDTLAEQAGANARILYRIMRALSSVGIFHEEPGRSFSNTPLGRELAKDRMQPVILMFLSSWHNQAWDQLLHSVRSGDIAFETAFGKPCFEWFEENPEEARTFNLANQMKATASHSVIADLYDFTGMHTLVDIGGGYGGLLCEILRRNPGIQGVVAELSYMQTAVEAAISRQDMAKRCGYRACDFFREIPQGGDGYILSNILHDWDDEECGIILGNCGSAMKDGAKLFIIESLIPGRNEFSLSQFLDLEVLVMGGGKERTEQEYGMMLEDSGLRIDQVHSTAEDLSILECSRKPFVEAE